MRTLTVVGSVRILAERSATKFSQLTTLCADGLSVVPDNMVAGQGAVMRPGIRSADVLRHRFGRGAEW